MKALKTSIQAISLLPIITAIVLTIVSYHFATNTDKHVNVKLPTIQGIILKEGRQLTKIQLTDHQGNTVDPNYFIGKWHFITYGYSQCPDICPTTLFTLTQLADLLSISQKDIDTKFIFYTIDPDRDTQEILAQYINFFSENFVAMRAESSVNAEGFPAKSGHKGGK